MTAPTPPSPEMRGIERAKAGLAGMLAVEVPRLHAAKLEEWGWTARIFPLPVEPDKGGYLAHAPAAIDRWPLIAVTGLSSRPRRIELDEAGNPVYWTTHATRTFVWARAQGMTLTERVRDDYATLVVLAMLGTQGFTVDGALGLVVEDSVVVTYSDIAKPVKGDRWVAAAQIDADVRVEEAVSTPPVGTVTNVTLTGDAAGLVVVDGDLLPIHPSEL